MEEINEEQLAAEPTNVSTETNDDGVESEAGSSQEVRQATAPEQNFGKFKSLQDLLEAYNNLEAEFTKKCQKLSQFEKDKIQENPMTFDEFLSQNDEAQKFSDEIQSQLERSSHRAGPFEAAWAKVILSHLESPKPADPIFDRFVLANSNVQRRIVENYLNALNEQKSPIVISSQKGERVSSDNPDTPKTLSEARALVEKMFS